MRWYRMVVIGVCITVGSALWFLPILHRAASEIGSYCIYPFLYAHNAIIKPYYSLCYGLEQYRDLLRKHQELCTAYNELHGNYIALHAAATYARDVEKELEWFKKRFDATS